MSDNIVEIKLKTYRYSDLRGGLAVLILENNELKRRLAIAITSFDFQNILSYLENFKRKRPLSHDLIENLITHSKLILEKCIIYNQLNGIFYSKLIFWNEDKEIVEIEARTSDSISICLRFQKSIFIDKKILDVAGLTFEETEELTKSEFDNDINEELNMNSEDDIDDENFEFDEDDDQQSIHNSNENKLLLNETDLYSKLYEDESSVNMNLYDDNILIYIQKKAIINEHYELASLIQKELDKRKHS